MTTAQILALPLQTSSRLLRASDTGATYHIAAGQSGTAATTFPLNQEDLQLLLSDEALANRVALELDDGFGNLPAQGSVLANTGNVSLATNILSLNTAGKLIKHDGISDGDDLPYLEYGWRISKYQEVTAIQNQAGIAIELGRFTIPASLATFNRHFIVKGGISVEHGGDPLAPGYAVPGYVIGFVPAGVTPVPANQTGIGYVNNVTARASQIYPAFYLDMFLYGSVGSIYALSPVSQPIGVLLSGNSAAECFINLSQLAHGGELTEEGPFGVSHDMILYYNAPATASSPLSKVTVDLTIYPVL